MRCYGVAIRKVGSRFFQRSPVEYGWIISFGRISLALIAFPRLSANGGTWKSRNEHGKLSTYSVGRLRMCRKFSRHGEWGMISGVFGAVYYCRLEKSMIILVFFLFVFRTYNPQCVTVFVEVSPKTFIRRLMV